MSDRPRRAVRRQSSAPQKHRNVKTIPKRNCVPDEGWPCMDLLFDPSEHRYCLLFQECLAGIYTTTAGGRMIGCNEAMVEMLGYESRGELMALKVTDLYVSPSERREFLRRLQESGKLTNQECRLKRKDGTVIDVLENVSLLPDEAGKLRIIHGNMVDITERKRTEKALHESERSHRLLAEQLRRLANRQESVREKERARIARELHDEFGQALTALNMDLGWLSRRTRKATPEVHDRIDEMAQLVCKTTETLQRICAALRPTVLDDFGLIPAIDLEAREFERRTGIRCRVRLPRNERFPLGKQQETAVFRILQESLTNVNRHARASEVNAGLSLRSGVLTMTICDNGTGISQRAIADKNSLGLVGMRERALAWGGTIELAGSNADGTTVTLRMPVEPETQGNPS